MISEEKIAAYKQLDEAVDAIRKAFGYEKDILTGYVLLTSSVEYQEDCGHEDHDPLDLRSAMGWHTRRGQDPTLSYGILHEGLRHYNYVNERYGEDD